MPVVVEVAHHTALLPVAWLATLHSNGHPRPIIWWALAGALLVSWVADTTAHWISPWAVSSLYPIAQVTLIAAAVVSRAEWPTFCYWFGTTAAIDVLLAGAGSPELFLHTVAWGALLLIVWRYQVARPLRLPSAVSFGLAWVAWVVYLIAPSWPSWGTYQGVRAVGLGVFCWASLKVPQPVRA